MIGFNPLRCLSKWRRNYKSKTQMNIETRRSNPKWNIASLIWLVLTSSAIMPQAEAITPPPDGGYSNLCTAEGSGALGTTTGTENTAVGFAALGARGLSGYDNTAIGAFSLETNTSGFSNTAIGASALTFNLQGSGNTATGNFALELNNGFSNTANGSAALKSNTNGSFNTAIGAVALTNNLQSYNTATGYRALASDTYGQYNTANGANALSSNRTGSYNTAAGYSALNVNTGSENTATGSSALQNNMSGHHNTATGTNALLNVTTGLYNTATGASTLQTNQTGSSNTADGTAALFFSTGSNNIALGNTAGFFIGSGNNNIDIGNTGADADSDTIRIGTDGTQASTYIAGILDGTLAENPVPVLIDANGKLGTAAGSSQRFKNDIKSMGNTSEAILSLRPVTFHYKTDKKHTAQFGLIAEEVAKLNPDLVLRDKENKPYTVRYEAVNAMLLNEFLKERRKMEAQTTEIAQLKSDLAEQRRNVGTRMARQDKAIAVLTQQLQQVSAHFTPGNLLIRGTTEQ